MTWDFVVESSRYLIASVRVVKVHKDTYQIILAL